MRGTRREDVGCWMRGTTRGWAGWARRARTACSSRRASCWLAPPPPSDAPPGKSAARGRSSAGLPLALPPWAFASAASGCASDAPPLPGTSHLLASRLSQLKKKI
eukprot:scaffold24271_cov112-Isochrysis_galbana.AAC.1